MSVSNQLQNSDALGAVLFTTRQMADLANVPVNTIRWYHKMTLLKPIEQSKPNQSWYTIEQVLTLQNIHLLRLYGFPLIEIRNILHKDSISNGQMLATHAKVIQRNIEQLLDVPELLMEMANSIECEGKVNIDTATMVMRNIREYDLKRWYRILS